MQRETDRREAVARLEARLRDGIAHVDSLASSVSGVRRWEIIHKDGKGHPATPHDTDAGAWEWVRLLNMQVQPLDNGTGTPHTWLACRGLIPVHPGYGDTPREAITAAVEAAAEAAAKQEAQR